MQDMMKFMCRNCAVTNPLEELMKLPSHRNQALSLTSCHGDETQLIKLPGQELKLCHSLSVSQWDMIDETSRHINEALSLTVCWSLNGIWWNSCERIVLLSLTHCWSWDKGLPGTEKCCVTHILSWIIGLFSLYCTSRKWCICPLSIRSDIYVVAWKKCTMNLPPVFHIVSRLY